MAWPYDAVKTTYGSLQPVASADLNDWQNRIVDLHRERKISLLTGIPENDASHHPYWDYVSLFWWVANAAAHIVFPIPCQSGFRLKNVHVKYYGGGAAAPTIGLYGYSANFDASATAPASEAALATYTTASNGAWVSAALTPAATELAGVDRTFFVDVLAGQSSDRIAGIRATFEPITPTP
jgi:hypothetical protein